MFFLLLFLSFSCLKLEKKGLNEETMASMGGKIKQAYVEAAEELGSQLSSDSTNVEALIGLADTKIILYIFGFSSRQETIPDATEAYIRARELDSISSGIKLLEGMLSLLDWRWKDAEDALRTAISIDPQNLNARHWYSLYLSAMGHFDQAMAQSDTIATKDPEGNYLIGRGSLLYFARRNEEMKDLMIKVVSMDTSVAWGYDWLGMAYIELEEYENSVSTYYKAFELSDGTVEVGGGLGHALGLAGEYATAKQMADYYSLKSGDHYLPPVQRAFIHIGIGEYDEAIRLLEQAYEEHSWFLAFIQAEPWYDPIRNDERFDRIINKMKFPG
ncbi:MAG: hypothetical protein GY790_15980 [Bacteroidetes bacterium]|nr:hypothetical protein [Bacteroidota bacterium]